MRGCGRPFSTQGLKSILVIAPHPDDETLGCGGTLVLSERFGTAVHVAILTDGGASHPGHPQFTSEELVALRREEAITAASRLGLKLDRVAFLNEPDGTLANLNSQQKEDLVRKIAKLLERISPDVVLLTYGHDGSSEHDASYELVQLAVGLTGREPRMLEYPIWAWRNPLRLLRATLTSRIVWRSKIDEAAAVKAEAIEAYVSQTKPLPPDKSSVLQPDFLLEFHYPEEFFFER